MKAPNSFPRRVPEFRVCQRGRQRTLTASHALTDIRRVFLIRAQASNVCFAVLLLSSLVAFWPQLRSLLGLAASSLNASHVVLVPPLCAYLIWLERKRTAVRWQPAPAAIPVGVVLAFALSISVNVSPTQRITLGAVALVVFWICAFALSYGVQAAYSARFSLLLLFLTVPPPQWAIHGLVIALQHSTAWCVAVMFRLLHVPAVRDGIVFSLPVGSFDIGPGCSGIRSTIAFLIISLVVGHLLLRSLKSKFLVIAAIAPLLVFKNGVRIVTLSLLGYYVDRGFLKGRLHSTGGIVFFLFAILLWTPFVRLAQRLDRN